MISVPFGQNIRAFRQPLDDSTVRAHRVVFFRLDRPLARSELIRAANAVLKGAGIDVVGVVTKQLQVVNGEKSRKSRADGYQRKNESGAVAPN